LQNSPQKTKIAEIDRKANWGEALPGKKRDKKSSKLAETARSLGPGQCLKLGGEPW
jgi:hypothetical protein